MDAGFFLKSECFLLSLPYPLVDGCLRIAVMFCQFLFFSRFLGRLVCLEYAFMLCSCVDFILGKELNLRLVLLNWVSIFSRGKEKGRVLD